MTASAAGALPRAVRVRPGSAQRGGFTFIELMVVITIIGFMSAVAIGRMDGMTNRSRLRATTRALGNLLLSVKQQAVVQGRELTVEIAPKDQRWRVVDIPPATDYPDPDEREERTYYGPWEEPAEGVVLEELSFSRSDVQRSGSVRITFDSDGQLSPAGFVVFFRDQESDDDDEGITVEITGLTGLVEYYDGRKKSEEVRDADDF